MAQRRLVVQVLQVVVRLAVLILLVVQFIRRDCNKFCQLCFSWGTSVAVNGTVSDANSCEPDVSEMIVLVFALSLVLGVREGYNVFVTRTIGGFIGASVVVALVAVPSITVPGT